MIGDNFGWIVIFPNSCFVESNNSSTNQGLSQCRHEPNRSPWRRLSRCCLSGAGPGAESSWGLEKQDLFPRWKKPQNGSKWILGVPSSWTLRMSIAVRKILLYYPPARLMKPFFLQSLQSSSPIRLTWPLKNRQYLAGKATSKPFLETFRSRVRIPAFRPGDYVSLCVNIIFPYQNHLMWWSQPHKNDVLPFCPTKCGQDESRYK